MVAGNPLPFMGMQFDTILFWRVSQDVGLKTKSYTIHADLWDMFCYGYGGPRPTELCGFEKAVHVLLQL